MSRRILILFLAVSLAPCCACKQNPFSHGMAYLFMSPLSPEYYQVDPEVRRVNGLAAVDTSDVDGRTQSGVASEIPANRWANQDSKAATSQVAYTKIPEATFSETASARTTPAPGPVYPPTPTHLNEANINAAAARALPAPQNQLPPQYTQPGASPISQASSSPRKVIPPIFQEKKTAHTDTTLEAPIPGMNKMTLAGDRKILYLGAAPGEKRNNPPKRRPVFMQAQFEEPHDAAPRRPLGQLSMKKEDWTDKLQIDPNLANRSVQRPQEQSAPRMESLIDGGDNIPGASVRGDRTLGGVDPEDTLVVYENSDGRHSVQPSNRVHVYSPRFGSVRQVEGLTVNEQRELATAANGTTKFGTQRRAVPTGNTEQEQSALYARSKTQLEGTRGRFQGGEMSSLKSVGQTQSNDLATSFSTVLRQEKIETKVKSILAQGKTNAICWSGSQGLLVRVNELALREMHGIDKAATVYQIDDGQTVREIRLIKVADKETAAPGEIVEFTLRFDNTGDETLQNITVLDSLTGRLEFLPDSAKSSVPASFYVEPNEAGSLILRWELTEPLKPREFGIVVFQCRVR